MYRKFADLINEKRNESDTRKAVRQGPIWLGKTISVNVNDDDGHIYNVVWLPDRNNDLLRKANKAQWFYYVPSGSRLARNQDGSFKFLLQSFSGVMDPTKNIGEDGFSEVAGGCLSITTTLSFPDQIIEKAFSVLKTELQKLDSDSNPRFAWKEGQHLDPDKAPVSLHENKTLLHSIRYGGVDKGEGDGDPDAWSFEIQGEGKGTTNIEGTNAFTVMLGNRPVQMLMAASESGNSQITLANEISYYVWQTVTEIKITAHWDSVYDHYSHHIKGGVWFLSGDFKKVTNDLIQSNAIEVEVLFGAGMVDAKKQEDYEKAADEIAKTMLLKISEKLASAETKATEDVATAEAKKFNFAKITKNAGAIAAVWGSAEFGAAFKSRRDDFSGTETFSKKVSAQELKSETLSSQMEGLFDELKNSEEVRQRYFSKVFFEEGFKKVHVVATANANWGDGTTSGDPIHRIKLQVGYPDSKGNLVWKSAARYKDNDADGDFSTEADLASWTSATKRRLYAFNFTRHDGDKGNEDQIHIKKIISFQESPKVATNEVIVEDVTNTHVVEVRAESVGKLSVGPISLDMPISEDDKQVNVLVHISTPQFGEEVIKFDAQSINDPKEYSVWYASPEKIEPYKYKVSVVVKGSRFGQKPIRWEGNWQEGTGSGPLVAEVPPVPEELADKVDEYLGLNEEPVA